MSDDGVPPGDMSSNLFPFRHREPAISADESDALLSGDPLAADASPQVQALGDAIGALRRPGHANELAGASAAVAAFAEVAGSRFTDSRPARRRTVLTPLLGAKVAIAAVAGSLALGGAAAAAGITLPGTSGGHPIVAAGQTSSAPSASASASNSGDPTGTPTPTASPSAKPTHPRPVAAGFVYGWCRAFSNPAVVAGADQRPDRAELLAKLTALAAAKGGTVTQLCAAVLAAGDPTSAGPCHGKGTPDSFDDPNGDARGKPGDHQGGQQGGHGTNGHSSPGNGGGRGNGQSGGQSGGQSSGHGGGNSSGHGGGSGH